MSWSTFLTEHILLLAFIVIAVFIAVQIMFARKPRADDPAPKQASDDSSKPSGTQPEKDTVLKRMGRGFGVMYKSIANSAYVQGMREEQKTAKFTDMMPAELVQPKEQILEAHPKNEEAPRKKGKDPFATDLSNLGQVDF